jgi:DNA-binding transcriptional ArsR family regulator
MDDRRKLALSHPRRIELLSLLAGRADGEGVGGGELADSFDMHIRLVGYHLQILQGAGLVATVAGDGRSGVRQSTFIATSAA